MSVSMCVATNRVKSGLHFNIRHQAGCIRAFWCKMVGIIARLFLIMKDISVKYSYSRSVRKVSSHFEYLENRLRGLDVTWQPVRGDLTVHL